jgi:predicted permease
MGTLIQDLRYGLRMLRKSPGLVSVAVLTLALGIGANTAIFNVVEAVLLKGLPVRDPQQLVQLIWRESTGEVLERFRYPDFEAYRENSSAVLSGIFAFQEVWGNLNVVYKKDSEMASGLLASSSMYSVLGVQPALGRLLNPDDDRSEGCCPVVALSHGYWQRRFGGDPGIIGQPITLNGRSYTIVGVTAKHFRGLRVGWSPDITLPITMVAAAYGGSFDMRTDSSWLFIMGRRLPGVANAQVRTALEPIFRRSIEYWMSKRGPYWDEVRKGLAASRFDVLPAGRGALSTVRSDLATPLLILMTTVGLLLLIACINVATLLLARAATRQKEISVRLAIGASRGRLIRQLLTESLLLALLGGAAGLVIGVWGGPVLASSLPSDQLAGQQLDAQLDWRVLAFAALLSLATGVLFGIAPALRSSRLDLNRAMKAASPGNGSLGGRRATGKALVVGQLALSLPMLVAAGLFVRTLENLKNLDLGYRRENVVLFSVAPRLVGYRDDYQLRGFYQQVLAHMETIPGVLSATLSTDPMGKHVEGVYSVEAPGYQPRAGVGQSVLGNDVGPRFVETLGMTLLLGRDFGYQDSEKSPLIAIVNESFARDYFGSENAIGKKVRFVFVKEDPLREIVGVVKDARDRGAREPTMRVIYVPYLQRGELWDRMIFTLRTAAQPTAVMTQVREHLRAIDPTVPAFGLRTLEAQTQESLARERLVVTLSSGFGMLALLLVGIGLFGVLSYTVAQRTKEIGIRMALGAQRGDVLWLVMREVSLIVIVGIAIGLLAALGLTRFLQSQLFGLQATDVWAFGGATFLIVLIALLSGYIPAHRAAKVDPMVALRYE